jgi:hypothetical protein
VMDFKAIDTLGNQPLRHFSILQVIFTQKTYFGV